ncbi:MAG: hypothetical protein MUE73_19470 [Planctomycetes bacterium]|nr:hypothetical protein [Planctomycetota bacterium]
MAGRRLGRPPVPLRGERHGPLYGNLRGLLAKDEIRIYGFPLYLETSERGYEAWHVLWPLVSGGEGDGKRDFRILPFWSWKENEGKSFSRSILWPFFTWGEERLDTDHPVSHFFIFPFYGSRESDVEWTTTWLFPFFSDSGNAAGWRETNLFFPVYRRVTGEDEDAFRIWPLYGYRDKLDDHRQWFLWPVFWHSDYPVPEGRVRSFQAAFLFRDAVRTTAGGGPRGSDTWIWPLARRTENAEGTSHVRFLSLFPFLDDGDFDANWAWLWTLLEARTGRDETAVSLLSGFLGYEEKAGEAALRLLWLIRIPL